MNAPRQLSKPYRNSGAFHALLPVKRFAGDYFLTKSGTVGILLKLQGIDASCATDEVLASYSARLYRALGAFGEDFRLYHYLVKHAGATLPVSDGYINPTVAETVIERKRHLESRGLYSLDLYLVVLYEPRHTVPKWALGNRKLLRHLAANLKADLAHLRYKVEAFVRETADLMAARILHKAEAFQFLRHLANLDPHLAAAAPLLTDTHVDYFLSDSTLSVHPDHLEIGGHALEVLAIKEPPKRTRPDLFDSLVALPADFVLCVEWKPLSAQESVRRVRDGEGHFRSVVRTLRDIMALVISRGKASALPKDHAAENDLDELGGLAVRLNDGDALGHFSTTIVFHGPHRDRLRDAVAEAIKLFGRYEGSLFRESYNALNTYLSIFPGNQAYNLRKVWLLGSSYADLAPVYAPAAGEERNAHLDAEYLIPVETPQRTAHLLNLHCQDVLGVFVTGKTGSGKSLLCQALLDHFQKYEPLTLILDIGGSYRQLCRKHEGAYMSVGALDFAVNPFSIEPSKRNHRFLAEFVRLLLANEGYRVTFDDARNIFEAIEEIYTRDIEHRRLCNLKLPDHLWPVLYRWTGRGEFGSVFDNVRDDVTFSNFKVFDFAGIEELPEVAEPLFYWLFVRWDQVVRDPQLATRLKILHADECWRFLENSTCRKQLLKAGKTFRKHNGGLILATQSAFELSSEGLRHIIGEVTPVKILLANQSADLKAYGEFFHLSDKEMEAFRTLVPKRQFLLKREEDAAQIFELNVSAYELEQYRTDPAGAKQRDEAIERYGFEEGLKVLANASGK